MGMLDAGMQWGSTVLQPLQGEESGFIACTLQNAQGREEKKLSCCLFLANYNSMPWPAYSVMFRFYHLITQTLLYLPILWAEGSLVLIYKLKQVPIFN